MSEITVKVLEYILYKDTPQQKYGFCGILDSPTAGISVQETDAHKAAEELYKQIRYYLELEDTTYINVEYLPFSLFRRSLLRTR